MVCGCSSMMKVNRFWLSTFCRKPKGKASIDWRTLSSVRCALAQGLFDQFLGNLQPAGAPGHPRGLAAAKSWIVVFLLLAGDHPLAISMETASTCFGGACSKSRGLIVRQAMSRMAALRTSGLAMPQTPIRGGCSYGNSAA